MDELTVERVVEVFRKLGVQDGSGDRMTIGTGLLYCGWCRRPLRGGHGDSTSWSPGTSANYDCAHCAAVSVPVHRVDAQLQALTVRRLESPEFVSSWRDERVAELDTRIAEGTGFGPGVLTPRISGGLLAPPGVVDALMWTGI
ncbi:hypothetical protein ABZ639_22185 [Saccharomonospora sp. NPDC006951]